MSLSTCIDAHAHLDKNYAVEFVDGAESELLTVMARLIADGGLAKSLPRTERATRKA